MKENNGYLDWIVCHCHAIEGIQSNGQKDAFGNDMDVVGWGLMGLGAGISIWGNTAVVRTGIPLGLDVGNRARSANQRKENKP